MYALSGSFAGRGAASSSVSAPPPLARLGLLVELRDAVRDVRHDVEPRDALLLEQRDRERVALGEHGDEDVRARHLFLAARLHVRVRRGGRPGARRAKAAAAVGLSSASGSICSVEERVELLLEGLGIAAGVTDDVRRRLVEQERVEQVLDRDVLVPPAGRVVRGDRQRNLDLGAESHPSLFVGVSLGVARSVWVALDLRSKLTLRVPSSGAAGGRGRVRLASLRRPWSRRRRAGRCRRRPSLSYARSA